MQSIGGFGGIGKTRLALAYADRYGDCHPDGRVFYDFQSYANDRAPQTADQALLQILPTVSGQLSATDVERLSADARLSAWREIIAQRQLLMVWDNVGHISQVADLLVRGQNGCATIITSRNSIDLDTSIAPLILNVLDSDEARSLFRQIAGSDHPREKVQALVEADLHIPVLIEFHAFQVLAGERSLSEIVTDLDATPLDPNADVQQQLFDRLDGSYHHLDAEQRYAVRAFGAHPGQFATAASLAAVMGYDLAKVRRLMDDLIHAGFARRHFHSENSDSHLRSYTAHDSLRAYAVHQAKVENDYNVIQNRLLDYYLRRLNSYSDDDLRWISIELGNISDCVLAGSSHRNAILAEAAAFRAMQISRYSEAFTCYSFSATICQKAGNKVGYATAQAGLGDVALARDEIETAANRYKSAAALYSSIGNLRGHAAVLVGSGSAALLLDKVDDAMSNFLAAVDICKDIGDKIGHATALLGLGRMAMAHGHEDKAIKCFQDAVDVSEECGDQIGRVNAMLGLGRIALSNGSSDVAAGRFQAALDICEGIGNESGRANALTSLGDAALQSQDQEAALDYWRKAVSIFSSVGAAVAAEGVLARIQRFEDDEPLVT
ncbi:tetratricopeptide repeat protein [Glycomyces tarimensis]